MNTETIGMAAGKVWAFLSENGESSRAQLKKGIEDIDEFILAAAVGWLAREDKIMFVKAGRSFNIVLK
ncbi:MAG: winged helix-turn-helix domain-containing protein [Anaerolineae bacterium]|nr:winged helix-turn-helix domain-containing protein [Anaerolineae bacterium]